MFIIVQYIQVLLLLQIFRLLIWCILYAIQLDLYSNILKKKQQVYKKMINKLPTCLNWKINKTI